MVSKKYKRKCSWCGTQYDWNGKDMLLSKEKIEKRKRKKFKIEYIYIGCPICKVYAQIEIGAEQVK